MGGQHHRSLRGSPFTRSFCPQDTLQRLCDHPLSTGEEGGCPVQGTVLVIWTELLKSFLKDMMTTIMQMRKQAEGNEGSVSSHPLTVSWCFLSSPSFQVHEQNKCPPSGASTLTTNPSFASDS